MEWAGEWVGYSLRGMKNKLFGGQPVWRWSVEEHTKGEHTLEDGFYMSYTPRPR